MTRISRRQFLIGSAGVALSALAAGSAVSLLRQTAEPSRAPQDVEFTLVDHTNLRDPADRLEDSWQEVESVKRNVDQAVALGIGTYVLFARDTFEATLPYDFDLPGVGNLAETYQPGGKTWRVAEGMRACLTEAARYAHSQNVRLLLHTNQFETLPRIYERVQDRVVGATGTPVCPGREDTWRIYRGKIDAFSRLFPDLDGLQITADESDVTILDCHCQWCERLDPIARINHLTEETARAMGAREAQMRTWQFLRGLDAYDPQAMTAHLPPNVTLSLKNTRGDFMLDAPFDDALVGAGDAARQVIEFDAWGEYYGHNTLPCYMGDIWAPRFATCAARGIRQYAVRMNWGMGGNPLFERPWAGLVNLHTALALGRQPGLPADEALRQFIAQQYPVEARDAAFAFYKSTPDFMRTIYYVGDAYLAHHSRLLKTVESIQETYATLRDSLAAPDDFERQRQRVEAAYAAMAARIAAISGISPTWREEMERGAQVMRLVGLGLVNELEAVSDHRDDPALRQRIDAAETAWQALDPDSFRSLRGEMPRLALEA